MLLYWVSLLVVILYVQKKLSGLEWW